MNSTKDAHELQQGISKQEGLEEKGRTVYHRSTILSLRNSGQ